MQINRKGILAAAILAVFVAMLGACGGGSANTSSGGADPNETAATVNGKVIRMEEVDRAVKQQAQRFGGHGGRVHTADAENHSDHGGRKPKYPQNAEPRT